MKNILVEHINKTSPVKRETEDAWVMNGTAGVYGVMDGATPLVPFEDEAGHNGAYLAANTFKKHFAGLTPDDCLTDAVQAANESLYRQMKIHDIDVSKGYERWTTCVAAVKIDSHSFEYVHLGDSMILITDNNGEVECLTEDTVKGISERAKLKRMKDREANRNVADEAVFENRLERLKYNRTLANEPGGYTVADGTENTLHSLHSGRKELENAKEILIISDGLFHPDMPVEQICHLIRQHGLEGYIQMLTEELEKRALHVDDRTAVRLTLA